MTPCRRGCCFTGLGVCAKSRACPCHPKPLTEWLGAAVEEAPGRPAWRDPTSDQAIKNVMNQQGGKRE